MPPKAAGAAAPAALRCQSFKYGMPLYGAVWPEGDAIFLCGGGGSASSGIKNRCDEAWLRLDQPWDLASQQGSAADHATASVIYAGWCLRNARGACCRTSLANTTLGRTAP